MSETADNRLAEIEVRLFGRRYSTLQAEVRVDSRLARALDLIESGWHEESSSMRVHEMAKAAGMSPTAFKAAFRERTGLPPHQFLVRRRTLEAARLMQCTRLGMAEIALEAGFTNITGLERNFRRLLDMTPGEFMKRRLC